MRAHSLTSAGTAIGMVVQSNHGDIRLACLGFDVSEVGSTPTDHLVQIGVDLRDAHAACEHFLENGLRDGDELGVGLADTTLANGDKARIILLAGPEQHLTDISHPESPDRFALDRMTEAGAANNRVGGGDA